MLLISLFISHLNSLQAIKESATATKCRGLCSSCNPNDLDYCLSCKAGYELVIGPNNSPTGRCSPSIISHTSSKNKNIRKNYIQGPVLDENNNPTGNKYDCPDDCFSCNENYEICNNTYFYDNGYVVDKNGKPNGELGKCPDHCEECSENRFTCTRCKKGFLLSENKLCQSCPSYCDECKIGSNGKIECTKCAEYFGPDLGSETLSCKPCPANCIHCQEDHTKCTECDSYYYTLEVVDGENTGKCILCPENCVRCNGQNNCTSCSYGYGLEIVNGLETGRCAPCPENCDYCEKDSSKCRSCHNSYGSVIENGKDTGRCAPCPENCSYCFDSTKCYNCNPGYGPLIDGKDSVKCAKCPDHCSTCNTDSKSCSICDKGYGYGKTQAECLKCSVANCADCHVDASYCITCQSGYHLSKENNVTKCIPCGEHCQACSNGLDSCKKCENGYGPIIDENGIPGPNCQLCKEGCKDCSEDSEECKECLTGYGLEFDPRDKKKTGKCVKCTEICQACDFDSSRCLRCKTGYGFILNDDGTSTGKCGSCPANCEKCYKDHSWCTDCQTGYGFKVDKDGKITNTCERCPDNCIECTLSNNCKMCNNQYGFIRDMNDPSSLKCGKCADENCEHCEDDNSYCSGCNDFFSLEIGKDGLYTGKCVACPKNCLGCSRSICSSCASGFSQYIDANGKKSEDCQPCPDNCERCTDGETCTRCHSFYKLVNNKCILNIIEHCIHYDDLKCLECEDGYKTVNDRDNCAECSGDECNIGCKDGYSMSYYGSNYGKCFACPEGCLSCNVDIDINECLECMEGYSFKRNEGIVTSECIKCTSDCERCVVDHNYCDGCLEEAHGFIIENGVNTGKCAPCVDPFCEYCPSDNTKCITCENNCYMDVDKSSATYGKCISSSDSIIGCGVENCFRCNYYNPTSCEKCKDGFCLYLEGISNKCRPCQTSCNVENCKICISGHSDQCQQCNDGFCVNEDSSSDNYKKCGPCNVPCEVKNCLKCVSGSSDRCQTCNSGYVSSVEGKCIESYDTINRNETKHEYIEINDNEITNNIFNYDGSKYDAPTGYKMTINLNQYDISQIVIDTNGKDFAVEIKSGSSEITLKLKNDKSSQEFDIYPQKDSQVTINLDGNSHASIKKAQGIVTINGANNAEEIKLNQVEPNTKDFQLIPSVPVIIDVVDFNKNQGLLVQSSDSQQVKVKTLKVQQKAEATIQNATITDNVAFGVSSSLNINEFVDLTSSSLDFPYNLESEDIKKAFLNGKIKSKPKSIKITNRKIGIPLSQSKILLAESPESFCNGWKEISTVEATDTELNDFECVLENSDSKEVYRFYAIQKKSDGDPVKSDEKDKLNKGAIAGIAVACVVVVGVVVFLLVFFLVIKKKKDDNSEQEAGNEKDADEV